MGRNAGVPQYQLAGLHWAPTALPCHVSHPDSGQAPAWGIFLWKESGGGAPTALPASPLALGWHQGNGGKALLCAWYRDAAEALLTAELVPPPELLGGLVPDVEMGGRFGFTSWVPA